MKEKKHSPKIHSKLMKGIEKAEKSEHKELSKLKKHFKSDKMKKGK